MVDPKSNQGADADNDLKPDDSKSHKQIVDTAAQVDESLANESQFEEPLASPSVLGEESVSGDAPDGEPADIDEEMRKVGITGDNEED